MIMDLNDLSGLDDNSTHHNQQQQQQQRPDIWLESQKFLLKQQNQEHSYLYGNSTILFVGSHFAGKTSIIKRFIDPSSSKQQQNFKYEETVGLEYYFAKRQSMSSSSILSSIDYQNQMKICNIWELGYELLFIDLIKFVITSNTIKNCSLVVVIDLTRPNELAILLESFLIKIRSHLDHLLLSDNNQYQKFKDLAKKRSIYYYQRNDNNQLDNNNQPENPLLIPLTIIGTKYDEFQNMDPEIKKQITKYLRIMSYYEGGQILYYSNKSETLTKRVNQTLDTLAFDDNLLNQSNEEDRNIGKPSVSTNISKPLLIPFGYDTLQKIGINNPGPESKQEIRDQFIKMFPQNDLRKLYESSLQIDPRIDPNFSEPEIDKILEYKYMLLETDG